MNMFLLNQEPNCTVFAQLDRQPGQLNGVNYVKFYARVEYYFMLVGAATARILGWKIPDAAEAVQIQGFSGWLVIPNGQDAEHVDALFAIWLFESGIR